MFDVQAFLANFMRFSYAIFAKIRVITYMVQNSVVCLSFANTVLWTIVLNQTTIVSLVTSYKCNRQTSGGGVVPLSRLAGCGLHQ